MASSSGTSSRRPSRVRTDITQDSALDDILDASYNEDEASDDSSSDIDPTEFENAAESSSSDSGPESETEIDNQQHTGAGDGGNTGWRRVQHIDRDQPPVLHAFTSDSGPEFTPANAEPVEYFERFFLPIDGNGMSLWELLVSETNKYKAKFVRDHPDLPRRSKVRHWTDVDPTIMRAFIGVAINMGLIRKHGIEQYWNSTDYSQDTPLFKRVFRLDTYKLILRFLHVSDSEKEPKRGTAEYDPTYKFRSVLDHFCTTWAREYKLGETISIDESIVGFKGRHSLVKYIRIKKHHQWGPKEYNLCDSKTGYCHQTMYHTKTIRTSSYGQPYDVCAKLMESHTGKNHHLVVDNYYTSVALCEQMLAKDTYVTGTVLLVLY